MPSPRAAYGRDYTAVSLQYDPVDRHGAAYVRKLRADAYAGHGITQRRRRTGNGWAVQPRNGLPEPGYRYRGTGYCMTPAEASRWLTGGA